MEQPIENTKKKLLDFKPSVNGFHFSNNFNSHRDIKNIFIANDAAGMCGGMALAICDYKSAGLLPPQRNRAPTVDDERELLDFIRQRQFDSVVRKGAFLNYISSKNEIKKVTGFFVKNNQCQSILANIEIIKQSINQNKLVPLGLIRASKISNITRDHQVVVYDYAEDISNTIILYLYDPNCPDNDNITITLNLALLTQGKIEIICQPDDLGPIFNFFTIHYTPKYPPLGIKIADLTKNTNENKEEIRIDTHAEFK